MCLSIAIQRPENVLATGEHLGFEWSVTHNGRGFRCGYVRVPTGHPWHGQDYDRVACDCHGGLTFAEADIPCGKGGEDNAWWVGFDCAHGGDASDPELPRSVVTSFEWGLVRTQEYVETQCRHICEQAATVQAGVA